MIRVTSFGSREQKTEFPKEYWSCDNLDDVFLSMKFLVVLIYMLLSHDIVQGLRDMKAVCIKFR